jgi:cell wall-associated NlpC family hydrolase
MQYGFCNQSIVPVRISPSNDSEQTTQLLYGDHFKVLEKRKEWSRIRIAFDSFEGWIDNSQYLEIPEEQYNTVEKSPQQLTTNLVDYIVDERQRLASIVLGSNVSNCNIAQHLYEGEDTLSHTQDRNALIEVALQYVNTPYLWGGKTPFGIDCSGFTQMVYKICGYKLLREASKQATQGEVLSFIEESLPGDLAFFDDKEGNIIHVGIIMANNYVIHSHGKVRIDRIDHTGIFNVDTKLYSHQLRVIKKIIA